MRARCRRRLRAKVRTRRRHPPSQWSQVLHLRGGSGIDDQEAPVYTFPLGDRRSLLQVRPQGFLLDEADFVHYPSPNFIGQKPVSFQTCTEKKG